MDSPLEFLARLRGLGIRLWAEGSWVRCNARKGVLTPEIQAEIAVRKAQLLSLLAPADAGNRSGALAPLQPIPRDGDLPLSFAQRRLWFLEQLQPGTLAYSISGAVRLQGDLDVPSLERALEAVVARHEALRTTFRVVGDAPVQIVSPGGPIRLPLIDLCGLPLQKREEQMAIQALAEAKRPFDLARAPLFRFVLYRLDQDHHVLLLSMHHVIADGWSIGVFVRELGALYDCFSAGQESSLPELPIQYIDYAKWQRDWLQGEVFEGQLSYWRNRLHGAPAFLDLPMCRPRPAVKTHRGALLRFAIPQPQAESLSRLARCEGATLFMTLLGAFQVLLTQYSGQEDLVVGSPIAGRNRPELEGLIGFFVNLLVLRTDLSGNPTFRELLARVRETCLGAYAHQDMPFEKLVEELRPVRDPSRNPLFQVMFALQNLPMRPLILRGLSVSLVELQRGSAQFDLALHMQETETGMQGAFEYSTDLFEAPMVAAMARHFRALLAEIVAAPDRRLRDLVSPIDELNALTSAGRRGRAAVEGSVDREEFEL